MVRSNRMKPLISIISASLNQAEYMEDCIQSILQQSFKNWEHIVVDGKSTDNSLHILKKHPHIRWISEKDSGYWDAITKGVKMARGKYIVISMISDGYVNRDWLKLCAEVLENDEEVSLVWGFPRWLEDGRFTDVCFPHFHHFRVPQKTDWFGYWLMTGFPFPAGNFCIRKEVFQKCNPYPNDKTKGRELLDLNYNFNVKGYLPLNIPVVADFGRAHPRQLSEVWTAQGWYASAMKRYNARIYEYTTRLKSGEAKHIFRDGHGKEIDKDLDISKVNTIRAFLLTSILFIAVVLQRAPTKVRSFLQKVIRG